MGCDRVNCREYVLNAMVQFDMQRALLFLCSFARGYVNADADILQLLPTLIVPAAFSSVTSFRPSAGSLSPLQRTGHCAQAILCAVLLCLALLRRKFKLRYGYDRGNDHGQQTAQTGLFAVCHQLSRRGWNVLPTRSTRGAGDRPRRNPVLIDLSHRVTAVAQLSDVVPAVVGQAKRLGLARPRPRGSRRY